MIDRFNGNWEKPEIKHGIPTIYGFTVYYPERLIMGYGVDIGYGSFLQAEYGIELQDFVECGGGVFIYSSSTIDHKQGKVTIKKNAKIGTLSVIMPGVTVGENALIAAHSFVNKDVPDNGFVVGMPARSKKKRESK